MSTPRSATVAVLAALAVSLPGPRASADRRGAVADPVVFTDGFEPACPSSWSSAVGWSCVEGSVPVTGSSLVEAPGDPGCPDGMAAVDSFCIDRYEASLGLVEDGGTVVPWSPYADPAGERVQALSVRLASPQAYVTQLDAAAACAEAGKRLCTDAEWLRACRGPSDWTYPWGDDDIPGACADDRDVHPVVEYFQTTEPWIWSETDEPCLDQIADSLQRTGSLVRCESAEGVFDLVGNLQEWTADVSGTLRGGTYVDTQVNGPGCLYAVTAHSTSHRDYSTGFRCCADLGTSR